MTKEQRNRSILISRLAGVLTDMREMKVDPSLGEEALRWHERDDFEQLLNDWEAGRHPAQLQRLADG